MPAPRTPPLVGLLLGVTLLGPAGCGTPDGRLPLVPVKGKITVGGRAPVDARVRFHPQDPATAAHGVNPSARVRADGTFEGGSYVKGDGVPAGEYVLTVTWDESTGRDGEMVDRLGGRFADPKKSRWRVRVEAPATELEPFNIP
ncbi:hypothetical protein J0H58_35045 [bacterium]|nr:hypothetical protein [bacterium]